MSVALYVIKTHKTPQEPETIFHFIFKAKVINTFAKLVKVYVTYWIEWLEIYTTKYPKIKAELLKFVIHILAIT